MTPWAAPPAAGPGDAARSWLAPTLSAGAGGNHRGARTEPMLALINVAFLLLVFLLLLGPAGPVAPGVSVPLADATQVRKPGPRPTLALDRAGQAWAGAEPIARGQLADWIRTQVALQRPAPDRSGARIDLVADAALQAGELARVLATLADAGVARVHLRTKARAVPPDDVARDR